MSTLAGGPESILPANWGDYADPPAAFFATEATVKVPDGVDGGAGADAGCSHGTQGQSTGPPWPGLPHAVVERCLAG